MLTRRTRTTRYPKLSQGAIKALPTLKSVQNSSSTSEWKKSDFHREKEWKSFPALDFTEKDYIYNSELGLSGDVFKTSTQLATDEKLALPADYPYVPYYVRNIKSSFSAANSGIPGPFEYSQGYEAWGGDEKYEMGPQRYGITLVHFGHSHIAAIDGKVSAKRRDFNSPTYDHDMQINHLYEGSVKIFGWFGNVFDLDGNRIPDRPGFSQYNQLKGMMEMLITGAGAPPPETILPLGNDPEGKLDFRYVIGAFQQFTENLNGQLNAHPDPSQRPGPLPSPGTSQHPLQGLVNTVDTLNKFLRNVLRVDVDGAEEIPLMAWGPLMKMHQDGEYQTFVNYRNYYHAPEGSQSRENYRAIANIHSRHMLDGGRQMAAFFGLFYSATSFLDQLLNFIEGGLIQAGAPISATAVAIPDEYRVERTQMVHDTMTRFWMEHMVIFDDFNKASGKVGNTLENAKVIYETRILLLESCGTLGSGLGEVFRAFDSLIRRRGLFDKLAMIPDQ